MSTTLPPLRIHFHPVGFFFPSKCAPPHPVIVLLPPLHLPLRLHPHPTLGNGVDTRGAHRAVVSGKQRRSTRRVHSAVRRLLRERATDRGRCRGVRDDESDADDEGGEHERAGEDRDDIFRRGVE